jgi:hypothetical protein
MSDEETTREKVRLEISWEALEDAFENNAPEVHSYLHRATGEVLRVVDGVADPTMHQRIAIDASYLRVDPVSSREQYRWMERFIATVPDGELRTRLVAAIDGKGAFRRFKDVLLTFPADRERWFQFRTERLRSCMEAWLDSHDLEAVPRVVWTPPAPESAAETPAEDEAVETLRRARMGIEGLRRRLRDAVDGVPARDLDTALAFLEWLRDRSQAAAGEAFDPREDDGD